SGLAVLDLISNRQRVLKVPDQFATRSSRIGHALSFDFNLIRAPSDWMTHSSGGSMTSIDPLTAVARGQSLPLHAEHVAGYPECQRCCDGQSAERLTPCLQ